MLVYDRPQTSSLTYRPEPIPAQPTLGSAKEFLWIGAAEFAEPRLAIQILASGAWRYVEQELNRLLALDPGWNGYRARRMVPEAVFAAVNALGQVINEQSLPPQFFPLPDGGVQFEWHVDGDALEAQLDPQGDGNALGVRANGDIFIEGDLTAERLWQMRDAVQKMSERVIAGR